LTRGTQFEENAQRTRGKYDQATNEIGIVGERGLLMASDSAAPAEFPPSPVAGSIPQSIVRQSAPSGALPLFYGPVTKEAWKEKWGATLDLGADIAVVAAEGAKPKAGGILANRFDARKSLVGEVAANLVDFPISSWLEEALKESVRRIALDPEQLRRPSPPAKASGFRSDGSNIPWVVAQLERKSPQRHNDWIQHLQTALPDLVNVTTIDRPEDRHRYLSLEYRDGIKVPSWMASDGTLRLLALTLPAFIEGFNGIYLIEEPENGIHPLAIETMYQALSYVYDAQVLVATHSPVILSLAKLKHVLCFRKDDAGAAEVIVGTEHPELRDWRGEVNLGTLYASGVLG
jgi:hypothetical protein